MFFSAITKNSNYQILTKNLATFMDKNQVWKILILWGFTEKSNFGEEFTKNQHRSGKFPKKRGSFWGDLMPQETLWVYPPLQDQWCILCMFF